MLFGVAVAAPASLAPALRAASAARLEALQCEWPALLGHVV